MAPSTMARTLLRSIKLASASVSRNQRENLRRFGGGGGRVSYDVVVPHRTSPQTDPDTLPRNVRLPSYARSGRPDYREGDRTSGLVLYFEVIEDPL